MESIVKRLANRSMDISKHVDMFSKTEHVETIILMTNSGFKDK